MCPALIRSSSPRGRFDRDRHQPALIAEQALQRSLARRSNPAADLSQGVDAFGQLRSNAMEAREKYRTH